MMLSATEIQSEISFLKDVLEQQDKQVFKKNIKMKDIIMLHLFRLDCLSGANKHRHQLFFSGSWVSSVLVAGSRPTVASKLPSSSTSISPS